MLSTRALTCKIDNKETPCPNTQLETFLTLPHDVAKEGGLIQSGHSSFPFRFDRVRDTDCETLTCHVHARCYSAVFSATSLSTRVVERTKRRFFRKRRRADRQHELQQSSRGFRLGFDRLRDKDREAHTCHVHAKGQQRTALMFAGAIRQSPA